MGFKDKWTQVSSALNLLLESQYNNSMFYTNWPKDIEDILILLKLFPSNRVGRNALANRETFYNASEKLIKFCQVILAIFRSNVVNFSTNHTIFLVWSFTI